VLQLDHAESPLARVITFGEIMMRLTTPGNRRFAQATGFDITYGGGEANVAAALAGMGVPANHVTVFPDNDLGRSAAAFFQQSGVGTRHMRFEGNRLGLYFMERGAAMRPGRVVYDRYDSAFARLDPAWFDWPDILAGARWFHWTGITPAISAAAAAACLEAVKTARSMGITVSTDVNYRRNLWQWGKTAREVMPALTECCDIAICSAGDAADIFGIAVDAKEADRFSASAAELMRRFPNLKKVISVRREDLSASHNRLTGLCFDGRDRIESPVFDVDPIVDRIGGGDAFAAGYIYGSLHFDDPARTLAFATAASALKHTIEGDFNMVGAAEIMQVMQGDVSGRLLR